ncbi:hypothetical protein GCM10022254_55350 [Actinomadura meridiana]|uniref:Transposase n=1 Tax=Actinomadura meridiana TaxID=559626 RepID=A0ABP8CFH8_9ACTN
MVITPTTRSWWRPPSWVVAYSAKISSSRAAGPVARVFRDLMMPIFLKKSASAESLAWMYRHHVDWDEPVPQAA